MLRNLSINIWLEKGLYTRDDSQPLDLKEITSMLQRETSDENINYSIDTFAKAFKLVYQ